MERFMLDFCPLNSEDVEHLAFETFGERNRAICDRLNGKENKGEKKVFVLVINDYWRTKPPIISDFQILYVFEKFYQITEVLTKLHKHSDYIYSLYECVSYGEAYRKALLLQVDNPERYEAVSKGTMRAEYQSPAYPTGPLGPPSPTGATGPSGGEWPSVPTGPTPGHAGVPGTIGTIGWEGYPTGPQTYPTGPVGGPGVIGVSGHVGPTGYAKPKGWTRKFMAFIARLFKNLF